ncbi:lytic polysaccharide monooxygenase, partial [Saccharata proteae CBS 121410]
MSRFHSLLQIFCTLCALSAYVPIGQAHMMMTSPSPWDSPTQADASDRDYDIKSPLQADGSNFPCQGMTKATDLTPTVTYSAGQSYNMSVTGSANHNGGSCQLSLSYDNGKTFKVIKSMIGGCPVSGTSSYDFEIPLSAPSGTAVFAWTWMNKVGNREFYMDCAVVEIDGNSGGNLCSLPNLYVANIEDVNSCATVEGVDPVFPDPGAKVVYGDGMSSSSKASTSSGQCELPDDSCSSSGSSSSSNSTSES